MHPYSVQIWNYAVESCHKTELSAVTDEFIKDKSCVAKVI